MDVLLSLSVLILVMLSVRCQDKTYNFREEEPAGSFIGNIALDLNLAALISPALFNTLHYSIMNWGDGAQFRVDENNSGLFTKYKLDREHLCRFETQCVLKLRVAARSEKDIKKYAIWVNLLDINDHSPKFNDPSFTLQIPESVTVGKEYSLPGAPDEDRGSENSIQMYSIEPSSDTFSVVYFQQLDGTSEVNLVVNKALDRETKDFYSLVVVAKDGGSPPQSASLVVTIQVQDDNDNTPRFSQSQYSVQIGENTPSGTVIFTLTATDDDIGANAVLEYRLSSRQEASMTEMFQIDSKTGQLKSKVPLTSGSYTIIVEAVDNGYPQRVNQTEVVITVIDTDNNPPVIYVDPLNQDSQNAHVTETANKNALVAHVSVNDPDSGPNGIVLCYSQSAFFDLHALDDNDYILVVVRPLDREQTSEYRVALFCEDSGTPRLNATQVFNVIVDDINDNPPVFDKKHQQISLNEGNSINDVALVLSATDQDSGPNAQIYFSLIIDSNGFFKIPIGSNMLVCAKKLDRESQDTHLLEVVARDGGTPALSATATVTITVLDINDVAPKFLSSTYKFSITEGLPAGSIVGSVSAIDLDLGEGGEIEFSLPKWSTKTHTFQIQDNGSIKTLTPLDREARARFIFGVQATDKGQPRLTSQVEVQIEVLDINDNAPVFLFPSPSNNSVTLTLPVDTSKPLYKLQVVDADEGENGEVYFSLCSGNASQLFNVDLIKGELYVTRSLNSDDIGVYNLSFTATDRGTTPLNTTKHMLVHVMSSDLQTSLLPDTNVMIAVGMVCGALFVAVIIFAVVCFVKRRCQGKPLHYLNNKHNNSVPRVHNAAINTNQYSHHKEPNNSINSITLSCNDDATTSYSIINVSRNSSGFTDSNDLQFHPSVLQAVNSMTKEEEPDTSDKEINRMTSLRLQQAFQHISSIKSRLITPLDTNKPYEWREIRIPGHPSDFDSLSSRAPSSYNHNIDSGVGTDDDTVFLPRIFSPSHYKDTYNNHSTNNHHQRLQRYTTRPLSNLSTTSSSSQPSSVSLPNLHLTRTSDLMVFRPLSIRSRELYSSDTIDDQCTTTSGSYSIEIDDHSGRYKGSLQTRNVKHVHDIYV